MHTIRNARLQLVATALSNLGVGSVLAAIVTPFVRGEVNAWSIAGWLAVGIVLVSAAQWILRWLR
jgi:hypothetical protein